MAAEVIKNISKFEQVEEDGNLIITYKIYKIDRFKQEYDESTDTLYLKPKINPLPNPTKGVTPDRKIM